MATRIVTVGTEELAQIVAAAVTDATAPLRREISDLRTAIGSDTLLTPKQVEAKFGIDDQTVTRWVREGKLPNRKKHGRGVLVSLGDLIELGKVPAETARKKR